MTLSSYSKKNHSLQILVTPFWSLLLLIRFPKTGNQDQINYQQGLSLLMSG